MRKVSTLRRHRMPKEERRPEEVVGILREARARGFFLDEPSMTESLHVEGEALLEAGRPTEALEVWEHALAQMAPSNRNRQRTEMRVLSQWQADERHDDILHRVELIATREPADAYFGLAVLLAEIARKTDDYAPSDRLFDAYYATLEHHKTLAELEALPCFDLDGEPLSDPARAADGIIAELNPPPAPSV
jgi:tetratricopeptide (TPR) repeat protein